MKLPEFKNKKYCDLNKAGKIAFVERVCMDMTQYLNSIGRNSKESSFIAYWKDAILKHPTPSNNACMNFYYYTEELSLSVMDCEGAISSLKYNILETVLFVHNVITAIPTRSHLIDRLIAGDHLIDIEDDGVGKVDVLKVPTLHKKSGKPVNPDSLAQRIKRGEITRYEAYQKNKNEESL